jgi:PKD repeat protein
MGALFSINDAVELYADFLSDVTTGSAPLTVNFYDYSEAFNTEISSWLWDFGDDETSNNPDPVHTYLEPGLYNVSLTIEDNLGNSETITKSDYLIITAEEYTGTVWHISTDGSNIIGNGSSEYPFATIQHGMEIAVEGDTILIHPGTYYECLVFTDKNLTLSSLFLFTQDENYIQETVIDGSQEGSVLSFYEPIDSTCVISGLTITYGYNTYGGGIYCDSAHPCLDYLIISDNTAYNESLHSRGGGIYCINSNIKISNCVIDNNICLGVIYLQGGGIFISQGNPVLINVTVSNNNADYGAGIYFENSSPIISDSKIFNNYAFHDGGGIGCNNESYTIINNTLIYNNLAVGYGGGITCRNNSFVIMANNTISGNITYHGGGSVYLYDNSTCAIVNSILWDNEPEEIYFYHTNNPNLFYSAYSDIMGGFEGIVTNDNGTVEWLEGNIVEDPLFVCADSANYFLQAESPCIDAGISYYELEDNTILVDLAPQDYYGIAPDMGALEWFETSNEENVINNTINIIYNFPNPFNPETTISFSVTQNAVSGSDGSSFVNLAIFNVKGQKVKTLLNEHLIKGTHSVVWNGTDSNNKPVSSGIYFYKISSVNESVMKKMLLLK